MRGTIVINLLLVIVSFVIGWTLCLFLQNLSIFQLDRTINLSEVLEIIVDIILASLIAFFIDRSLHNQRVEKDFYISELDEAQRAFSELAKDCSSVTPMSLNQTVYRVEKPKKDLLKMWDTLGIRNKSFHERKKSDFDTLISNIKTLNSKLSDSTFFKVEDGYKPVSISNGVIHINKTVTKSIDETFASIKD